MRPFVHASNQLTSSAPGTSAPQQAVVNTSNLLPNLMQIQSQMGFVNNNANYNPNFSNGNAQITPGFMNIPNFNGHMGNSAQHIQSDFGFSPNNFGQNLNGFGFPVNGQLSNMGQGNPNQLFGNNGQFGWQNQLQSINQLGNMPMLNPSQVNALTQLLGCANQVAQAMNSQNAAFLGNPLNPQLGFGHPNSGLQQAGFSQQLPVTSQQLQNVSVPPSNPIVPSQPHGQSSNFQGNHGQKQGLHIPNSNHQQNKGFVNSNREASNWRNQKSQDRMHNPKGKFKVSKINEGKAGVKYAGPGNSANQSLGGKRRSLSLFYTEKEIQQWREERKRNFPSKSNMEKKLAQKQANADAADEDARLRRQQLKYVLAKQVELGFEVPEIPSHYLIEPEHQAHERDNSKRRFQNHGRFQNRFNKGGKYNNRDRYNAKRGTEDGSYKKHDRCAKRQRVENDNAPKAALSVKEPTLLQKLLSIDIKKDQSRLLQAFRFMVINSFFKEWPEKPLNFPKVIVKDIGAESDAIEETSTFLEGELSDDEHQDTFDGKDGENDVDPQEEGEITD